MFVLLFYWWFLFDNFIVKIFFKCIIYWNIWLLINIICYRVVFIKYYICLEDIKVFVGVLIVVMIDIEILMKMNDFVFKSVIIFRINYIVIIIVEVFMI